MFYSHFKKDGAVRAVFFLALFLAGCSELQEQQQVSRIKNTLHQLVEVSLNKPQASDLEPFFYGVTYLGDTNSRDQLVAGVLERKRSGAFSYSPEAVMNMITKYERFFHPAPQLIVDKYFRDENAVFYQDATMRTLVTKEPERVWIFSLSEAFVIFIDTPEGIKIAYSAGINMLRKKQ